MRRALVFASSVALVGCGQILGVEVFSEAPDGSAVDASLGDVTSPRDATTRDAPPPVDTGRGHDALRGDAARPEDGGATDASADASDAGDAGECGPDSAALATDENNCGACRHSCLGGACANGKCQPFALASSLDWPVAITLDHDAVFWVEEGVGGAGGLGRVLKDGGAFSVTPESPYAFGIATDGRRVFYSIQHGLSGVFDVEIDGGQASTLVAPEPGPSGVALDPDGGRLYWVDGFADAGVALRTADTTSGAVETLSIDSTGAYAYYVAIDAHHVYFTGSAAQNTVRRVPRDGGCADASNCGVEVIPPGGPSVGPIAVADASLYWVQGNELQVADKLDGGGVTTLATFTGGAYPLVDANRIYISVASTGVILRMPRGGGTLTTLATGQASPGPMASDMAAIYWVNTGTAGEGGRAADGQIMKLAK